MVEMAQDDIPTTHESPKSMKCLKGLMVPPVCHSL